MVPVLMLILLAAGPVWSDDCDTEYSCASCTEVELCANSSVVTRFSCPSSSPYCDPSTGSCSGIPTLACADTDSFPCTQDGAFPNPTNCQAYHFCKNGTSYAITCPSWYYFDSTQGTCVKSASCYTISCSGQSGIKVAYHYPEYYAYCVNSVAVLVERCPGAYQLDATSQKCVPACQAEGNKIPDVNNCTSYFYCTMEPYASVYTVVPEQCPNGYGFDPLLLRCVPLKLLPSCDAD